MSGRPYIETDPATVFSAEAWFDESSFSTTGVAIAALSGATLKDLSALGTRLAFAQACVAQAIKARRQRPR